MILTIFIFLIVLLIIIAIWIFYYGPSSDNNVKPSITVSPIPIPKPEIPIDYSVGPIIVIPGLGGTNLDFSIDETFNTPTCNNNNLDTLNKIQPGLWVNPAGLLLQKTCYLDMLQPVYNRSDETLNNLPGLRVFPNQEYIGDPTSSICLGYILNSDTCYSLTDYSKNFVDYFTEKGYRAGYNLFIPGYDFRLVPYREYADIYFDSLKNLVETVYQKTAKRIHLIGHSLGTLLGNMFLNKMSNRWKDKYIEDFIPISPSYDGAPKSLRTVLSGFNFGLPDIIDVKNNEFKYAQRNIAGLAATIPLLAGMYGEVNNCDNTLDNYEGTGEAVALYFPNTDTTKSYNVNDYRDGIMGVIRAITRDVNKYTGDTASTKYLDTLTEIMQPIAEEKLRYAYNDPGVKVYQIIVEPISTEISYLYDVSQAFNQDPIYTAYVVGDKDIPLYGIKIPELYGWSDFTDKTFPPIDGLDHFTAYSNSTVVYDYIYSIIK